MRPPKELLEKYIGFMYEQDFHVPEEQDRWIPVYDILSIPFETGRLAQALKMSRLYGTEKRPPIQVVECRFKKGTLYVVEDGNHRVTAASIRGEEWINAEISWVVSCRAGNLIVRGTDLYEEREEGIAYISTTSEEQAKAIFWMQQNLD